METLIRQRVGTADRLLAVTSSGIWNVTDPLSIGVVASSGITEGAGGG